MAKTKDAAVLAFKLPPESFLALMNNIKLNSFEDQLIPRCFALDERELLAGLYMKSRKAGAHQCILLIVKFLPIACTLISICLPQSLLRLILMEMRCETRKMRHIYGTHKVPD